MDSSAPPTTGAARIVVISVLLAGLLPGGHVPVTGVDDAAVALARALPAGPGIRTAAAPPADADPAAPSAPARTEAPDRTAPPAGTAVRPTSPPAAAPDARIPDPRAPAPTPPPGAGVLAPGAGYAWPLLPVPAVLTPFRAPAHAYGPGHRGVDLAGYGGQPVLAARAGTVVFAGPVAGHGVVSVQHDDGLRTTYEPVSPTVTAGVVVRAGDVIGVLAPGHAGCPEAVCLHWGVRRDRLDYLDPLVLLRPMHVRLLPVPDPWPGGNG